ncbi:tetratricopeptide repeat protein [Tautonia rosea]|uniref:tetratricopeptide repeat protein n=1 Tax=Tautonia rosea TaxID=2728037 RepID=UPI0014751342|nr:tetratricopeptide repeat protein [Tautonia rosea]
MNLHRSSWAVLTVLVLTSASVADDVVLVPGSTITAPGGRIRGKVERETPELVRIEGREVPLDQIAEVTYDTPGATFTQAKARENSGDLEQAAELYQQASREVNNPLLAQDARFRSASALARRAQVDPSKREAAIEALRAITTDLSSSRHYGPALELLSTLQLDARDFDAADRALQELAKLSWASDRAAVLRSQVMVKRGQSEQALQELESLVDRLPEGSIARIRADLARAEALAGLSRFDEAENVVRLVIDEADPEDASTLAPAYNTLGDCLRAAGKPRDALFAYLNTDILYPSQADEHARSLAAIAQLWRVLDRDDRAASVVERLREQYPNSRHLPSATEPTP